MRWPQCGIDKSQENEINEEILQIKSFHKIPDKNMMFSYE